MSRQRHSVPNRRAKTSDPGKEGSSQKPRAFTFGPTRVKSPIVGGNFQAVDLPAAFATHFSAVKILKLHTPQTLTRSKRKGRRWEIMFLHLVELTLQSFHPGLEMPCSLAGGGERASNGSTRRPEKERVGIKYQKWPREAKRRTRHRNSRGAETELYRVSQVILVYYAERGAGVLGEVDRERRGSGLILHTGVKAMIQERPAPQALPLSSGAYVRPRPASLPAAIRPPQSKQLTTQGERLSRSRIAYQYTKFNLTHVCAAVASLT